MQKAPNFIVLYARWFIYTKARFRRATPVIEKKVGALAAFRQRRVQGLNGFFYVKVATARLAWASQFARRIQVRTVRGCYYLEISTTNYSRFYECSRRNQGRSSSDEIRGISVVTTDQPLCLSLKSPVGSPHAVISPFVRCCVSGIINSVWDYYLKRIMYAIMRYVVVFLSLRSMSCIPLEIKITGSHLSILGLRLPQKEVVPSSDNLRTLINLNLNTIALIIDRLRSSKFVELHKPCCYYIMLLLL